MYRGIMVLVGVLTSCVALLGVVSAVGAAPYGAGVYGACSYQSSCTLSLSSSGSVDLSLLPGGGTICSSTGDSVSVVTDNALGYTLQLADTDTDTSLNNGASSINASTGSVASPVALLANQWGYRVDGAGGFGSGPTGEMVNVASLGSTFAGVPMSASPTTLKTTESPTSGDATSVWYGVCASAALPAGSYTGSVTYTAISN